MNLNPAPFSRLASTIRSGLVSTIAQTFAGVKTFAGGLIASAGVTINAALTVAKPPVVNEPSVYLPAPVSSGGYGLAGAVLWSTTNSYLHHSTAALSLNAYAVPLKLTAAFSTVEVAGGNGTGASDVGVKIGTSTADASVNASAKIASFRTGIGGTEVEKAYITKVGAFFAGGAVNAGFNGGSGKSAASMRSDGQLAQFAIDDVAIGGARTSNNPIGRNAVAATASSVVITNSLVTTTSHIIITPMENGTGNAEFRNFKVAVANGSFTVYLSSAVTVLWPFSWRVSVLTT